MPFELNLSWLQVRRILASRLNYMSRSPFASLLLACLSIVVCPIRPTLGDDGSSSNASPRRESHELRWDFENVNSLSGEPMGDAILSATGPTAPLFQGMPSVNQALEFATAGGYWRLPDGPNRTELDFTNGDPITLESWVRVDSLAKSSYAYIIGKGRTYENGELENHNYALRLAESGGSAKLSFLFSTRQEDGKLQYHRWTSQAGFALDGSWHHVAGLLPVRQSGFHQGVGGWKIIGRQVGHGRTDDVAACGR